MKQINATIISNHQILRCANLSYHLMSFQAPEIAEGSKPGQFLMLRCDNVLLRRPISLHSVKKSGEIELLYAVSDEDNKTFAERTHNKSNVVLAGGRGTTWLSGLQCGSEINIVGPLGNGYDISSTVNNILIVAGGIGIAPLRFLAETAINLKKNVTILLGARSSTGILPATLLPSEAKLVVATEDGSAGRKSTVVDLIGGYNTWADQIFACGPCAMYEAMNRQMETWDVIKPTQVSLEVRMGCGTGICYSCSIMTRHGMKRVCKEGPVFNITDIIWQEVRL